MMAVSDDVDGPLPALIAIGFQFPAAYNATLTARRWLCRPSAQQRTHHLHLVAEQHELERHLRFRDTLRARADLRAEYAELKFRLAREHSGDREAYTAAKTVFAQRVETVGGL